jgi:hypothetical protein
MAVPMSGAMRLTPLGDGRFQFQTVLTNHSINVTSQYGGFLEEQGANWTTTVVQTNDPSVVPGPVPTQVQLDGSTLRVQNTYGQSAVWQKQ